ncbi:MAG: hypothetical protein ACK4IX_11695, partial [Candidatus Sericytochromatia bacterium]
MFKKVLITSILLVTSACSNFSSIGIGSNQRVFTYNNVLKTKNGADISFKLGFSKKFTVKDNVDGVRPRNTSDITHVKFYLTTSSTDPLITSDLKFTSDVVAYSTTTDTYVLENVPTGGPYYVAVELFDNVAALTANNIIEPIVYGGTTGTRGITVSTNSVTVESNHQGSTP